MRTSLAAVSALMLAALSCEGLFGPKYGETEWTYEVYPDQWPFSGADVSTVPAIDRGIMYFGEAGWGLADREWGAVHKTTDAGQRLGRREVPGAVRSLALTPTGLVIYSTKTAVVAVRSLTDSAWSFEPGVYNITEPAVGADGSIYLGAGDSGLYALSASGSQLWRHRTAVAGSPVIGSGGAIHVAGRGTIWAIDRHGGTRWSYSTRASNAFIAALGLGGAVIVSTSDRRMLSLDRDGNLCWSMALPAQPGPAVVDVAGTAYFGLVDRGGLHAAAADGTLLWTRQTGWSTQPLLLGDDSTLYYMDEDKLYCINLDGSRRWRAGVGHVRLLTMAPGGSILLSAGNMLKGVTTASQGLAAAPWPCARHDLSNSGRQ
ncbi:MAG: PQQ-binding-like beta-propeller repeat protein [bacterium]